MRGKVWARDGRYAYHKLQEFAEASEDKRNVRVLDEYTWQDRVWRDRVKKRLWPRDRLLSLKMDKSVDKVQHRNKEYSHVRSSEYDDCVIVGEPP